MELLISLAAQAGLLTLVLGTYALAMDLLYRDLDDR
jgi:hypothetical protein